MKYFNKIKKYIPILIIVLYIVFIIRHTDVVSGDDNFFAAVKGNIFSILIDRYNTWTSRIFIEGALFSLMRNAKWLWFIINSLMILLLYYSVNKIFNKNKLLLLKTIIAILIIIFPYGLYKSAGWASTTINYLWPFALGIYSFTIIIDELRNKEYKKWKLIFTIPALIFASNQEQVALLLFGFLLVFVIYNYINNKKISKLQIIYLLIVICSLIFMFTCSGNINRLNAETLTWFKDFNNLNIIDKSLLSINTTYEMLLGSFNRFYILLYAVLAYYFMKVKNKKLCILSIILLVGSIILPFTNVFNLSDLYYSNHIKGSNIIKYLNLYSNSYNISIIISIIYIVFTLIVLYYTKLKENNKCFKYLLPIMFVAAILSKMVIGFSPTVFASSTRTGIFMLYLIMMIIIILVKECINMKGEKYEKK